jgi:hypothetical protein
VCVLGRDVFKRRGGRQWSFVLSAQGVGATPNVSARSARLIQLVRFEVKLGIAPHLVVSQQPHSWSLIVLVVRDGTIVRSYLYQLVACRTRARASSAS